jgi:hypothetical protein
LSFPFSTLVYFSSLLNLVSLCYQSSILRDLEVIMKRRDFLKQGTVALGLASSTDLLSPLKASESNIQNPTQTTNQMSETIVTTRQEKRSSEYLNRVQKDEFLPKQPEFAEIPADIKISPMPLAERIKRNIVPKRGFCSLAPGGDALISGNGGTQYR